MIIPRIDHSHHSFSKRGFAVLSLCFEIFVSVPKVGLETLLGIEILVLVIS